ncbi:MAG: VOC family protein [Acidobacteria bacterium]|nr:VOC family protein [Acidobacteriota bacterium]
MGGIIFFRTQKLPELREYYGERLGCTVWLDQQDCVIFRYANMLFGFCQRDDVRMDGMITFFFNDRAGVDRHYEKFKDLAQSPPKDNPRYRIYHFFATDPEGRTIEFQYFDHPIDWDFERY